MTTPLPPKPISPVAIFTQAVVALCIGFALPILTCIGLMFTSVLALQMLSSDAETPSMASGPAVALIRVEGVILSGEGSAFGEGGAYARDVIAKINQANDDDNVKAIVLAVNSPGGGVVASDEIYNALKAVEKPIVVMMGDLAASGGYYISMAADWIIANPNTLTGSIGVISEFPNAEGLLEKVGVEFVVITSGPRKDVGSPYREMTEAEQAYWKAIIDEAYEGFANIVAEGRDLPLAEVKEIADGSIYTGRQALELGLVDELGYEADAIAKAAELGGITGEPDIIEYENTPTFFDLMSSAAQPRSVLPTWPEVVNWLGTPALSARWVGP